MRNAQPAQTSSSAERQAEFRHLMGRFTTGVCVVSVEAGDLGVAAMTVNSFVSVSLDPMLVSWSLHNSSSQFDLFARAERFAVSILADSHAELALRYASRGDSQLNVDDFISRDSGSHRSLPVVAGALAQFECRRWSEYPAGDHTVIFGEVVGMSANTSADPGVPLAFFNGQFCSIDA